MQDGDLSGPEEDALCPKAKRLTGNLQPPPPIKNSNNGWITLNYGFESVGGKPCHDTSKLMDRLPWLMDRLIDW